MCGASDIVAYGSSDLCCLESISNYTLSVKQITVMLFIYTGAAWMVSLTCSQYRTATCCATLLSWWSERWRRSMWCASAATSHDCFMSLTLVAKIAFESCLENGLAGQKRCLHACLLLELDSTCHDPLYRSKPCMHQSLSC